MDKSITDKDWLDIVWKYFQMHSQQRILHFNYFIVFSTIITTAFITTIQTSHLNYFPNLIIGFIQIFLSFIFLKIENRNKFLIKHAENIIMKIEKDTFPNEDTNFSLFSSEIIETIKRKKTIKNKLFFQKHLSHGYSYKVIYIAFLIIGSFEFLNSIYMLICPC